MGRSVGLSQSGREKSVRLTTAVQPEPYQAINCRPSNPKGAMCALLTHNPASRKVLKRRKPALDASGDTYSCTFTRHNRGGDSRGGEPPGPRGAGATSAHAYVRARPAGRRGQARRKIQNPGASAKRNFSDAQARASNRIQRERRPLWLRRDSGEITLACRDGRPPARRAATRMVVPLFSGELAPLGLVISEGGSRFERASNLLGALGVVAVHVPAIFVTRYLPKRGGVRCDGTNGLRLAHRNAWKVPALTNRSVGVFEDDIVLPANSTPSTIRPLLALAISRAEVSAVDLLYLGQFGHFWATHAIWVTPKAARDLLLHTRECIHRPRVSVDGMLRSLCMFGRRKGGFKCQLAGSDYVSPLSLPGHLVAGLLWQLDATQRQALGVTSYLHDVRADGFMAARDPASGSSQTRSPSVELDAIDTSLDDALNYSGWRGRKRVFSY